LSLVDIALSMTVYYRRLVSNRFLLPSLLPEYQFQIALL
jgi:hypothetical protein